MTIAELLTLDRVFLDLWAADKRRLIGDLSRQAAGAAGVEASAIAEALNIREQLGSTGMGSGIAIPHARLAPLKRPLGLFARLRAPIDFEAIDGNRVDLVFLLLLPAQAQDDHLNALACVARRLRAEPVTVALRKAQDAEELYAVLTERGGA